MMLTIAVHLVITSLLITVPTIEIIVGRKKPPNLGGKEGMETTPSAGITQIRLGVDSGELSSQPGFPSSPGAYSIAVRVLT
jgi:hypothetical protein